jgi:uncharacterized OB-fold protein
MSDFSIAPDIGQFEIPIDRSTEPFWAGTARHALLLPRCGDCGRFRWPPGPFCPTCQSQAVDWVPAGPGRVYSFTVVEESSVDGSAGKRTHIPALIEFPDAGHVRLLAAMVGANPASLCIGASVRVDWVSAANATVPVFGLDD